MGVFDSIIGYESHDNVNNPNYTRSYSTGWQPRSHTGLLATYQVFEALGIAAGVANTMGPQINNRAQSLAGEAETRKTYMGSIALTVPDSVGFLAGSTIYAGIVDGFANDPSSEQSNYYLGATLNTPITGLKVGAAFDYVSDMSITGDGSLFGAGAFNPNVGDGHAYSGYVSFQATEKLSLHARGEYSDVWPGQFNAAWGREKFDVLALTGTIQYDLWKNVMKIGRASCWERVSF